MLQEFNQEYRSRRLAAAARGCGVRTPKAAATDTAPVAIVREVPGGGKDVLRLDPQVNTAPNCPNRTNPKPSYNSIMPNVTKTLHSYNGTGSLILQLT